MNSALRLLLAVVLFWHAAGHAQLVGIYSSERSAGHVAVAESLQAELQRVGMAPKDVQALLGLDESALDGLLAKSPRVLVTLGASALRQALQTDTRIPIVATLIPRAGFEKLMREASRRAQGPVHALFLDQPFARQLELIHLVQPEAKRIAVIWGSESASQRGLLQAALQARGWLEQAHVVQSPSGVGDGIKAVLEDADAFLAVADPAVINSATVSHLLMATYRARIGFFAFSPAYVKAGAVTGLYSSPKQVGVQTAEMVRTVLRGGPLATTQYPSDFEVSVNEHVARSLGMSLDESALLERLKRLERKP